MDQAQSGGSMGQRGITRREVIRRSGGLLAVPALVHGAGRSTAAAPTAAGDPLPEVTTRAVAPGTHCLSTQLPIPGMGLLPVNAFVIRAAQPVVVDTGVVAQREAFLEALGETIDLQDVRWIWLTHTDADHTGCLEELLAAAGSWRPLPARPTPRRLSCAGGSRRACGSTACATSRTSRPPRTWSSEPCS